MNAKQIIGLVFGMMFKLLVLVIGVMLIYKAATYSYNFGYQVFADTPVSLGQGRTVSVAVVEGKNNKDIGKLLEDKGVVRDGKVFYIQLMMSDYKDAIKPGVYDLDTSMNSDEILRVLAAVEESEEEEK